SGELSCSLPNPRNVHFESVNMKNVLRWSAPEGAGDGVLYRVKYSVYGVGRWIRKPECRNINTTWCDLSSETSDYEEQYYASVKAFLNGMCSDWTETTRFNPLTDTKIDPPTVSVSSTEKSISITLTAPEKWTRDPEGESVSLLHVYPGLQYNVSVLNRKTKKRWFFSISNNTLVVPWLEPETAYCVSAQIHVSTPLLHSGFSKEHCVATLKDQTTKETVRITFGYVLPVMLAAFCISTTCYCVRRYINASKQDHPTNLVWHYTDECKEMVFIPHEKIVVNLITVSVDEKKPSQESALLSDRRSPNYYTLYNKGKDLLSKKVLETKHLLEISHTEGILLERDQSANWPPYGQAGTKDISRQEDGGTVEYEHDVRAEDFSPGTKLEEEIFSPRRLQDEPQAAVGDLVELKTGQMYCPQLEAGEADPCLGEKIKKLNLKMIDAADELPVDLNTETLRQTSCPQLGKIAQSIPEKEGEQTILVDWGAHTGRLYIAALSSAEDQVCEGTFKCGDPEEEGILSRLYKEEVPDESPKDQEVYLLRFKEQWGLHVEMED
ncbi:I20RA protein, partial [Rhinopomastus cyanomelas]|nr:I20RA protein [Rhinopomastus cyanomelas]